MKHFIINLQYCCISNNYIPKKFLFNKWIGQILNKKKYIITIRIVDELEIKNLNFIYRGENKATNVLSFPCNEKITINYKLLGDLVLCKTIIEKEAAQYNTTLESHWAHMTIHGTLHLLGYDHKNNIEAYKMEKMENKIMLSLKYKAPYVKN
ncbi:rRNA maturation RNase YbeY [Buchnera aphidicola]|uniref:Endoribonuclease YbeY n=1 Tax=Buchnera aphidicola str. USDA (Myzus persicae) TaxID=1009856 RepID=W0P4E3_BUCMP|nr:rRNA maturation RNase YbeY [Buchnera aphidicola]AHG59953.1 Ybey [Buchnera aphidicola str. USDA (Myzus persicae)]AHG60533.1 Ybey [Buchnera aphidicola str. W106 (Myzus persicae)]AHG61106.1 Ybey [Buchnera aphidicola str. G002 (Myzus persicae)]AHG61678.1 Ybey [Buchnera aphidicola str. F009 (Myzus persicae)]WAI03364.1 MAG: rRNA maturation RNase YbeY [Buchnera aphidicola (Myzus persicae)]